MRTHSPTKEDLLEIAGVGTRFPHQSYWTSFDSTVEFVPEVAESLIAAVAEMLIVRFNLEAAALRIRTRLSASTLVAGKFDARATILFLSSKDESTDELERMRSTAARLLAAVVHPAESRSPDAEFLSDTEEPFPIVSLLESPFAPFLGTHIGNDLTAHVPGRPLLILRHNFRDAPRLPLTLETFEVIGQIHDTKLGGPFLSVLITAVRTDNLVAMNRERLLVTEDMRAKVTRVVRQPSRRLRITVVRSDTQLGCSARRYVYTLKSLRFDDSAQA